jgi:hypothetical protein
MCVDAEQRLYRPGPDRKQFPTIPEPVLAPLSKSTARSISTFAKTLLGRSIALASLMRQDTQGDPTCPLRIASVATGGVPGSDDP